MQSDDLTFLSTNRIILSKKKIQNGDAVVHQTYQTDVNLEHVIRGNSAVLKCSVPSFIADFVNVDAWLVDDDHVVHGDSIGKNPKKKKTNSRGTFPSSQNQRRRTRQFSTISANWKKKKNQKQKNSCC